MVKKTGLGKGLDALFSMPVVEEEKMQSDDSLQSLKLIDIKVNAINNTGILKMRVLHLSRFF